LEPVGLAGITAIEERANVQLPMFNVQDSIARLPRNGAPSNRVMPGSAKVMFVTED
jgi:hypothetical protein